MVRYREMRRENLGTARSRILRHHTDRWYLDYHPAPLCRCVVVWLWNLMEMSTLNVLSYLTFHDFLYQSSELLANVGRDGLGPPSCRKRCAFVSNFESCYKNRPQQLPACMGMQVLKHRECLQGTSSGNLLPSLTEWASKLVSYDATSPLLLVENNNAL